MPVEDLILSLQSLPPHLIYLAVFSAAFIENLFPPSPSDLLIVFAGSLIGIGSAGFVESLLAATLGSTLGFLVMYKVGAWFGHSIVDRRRIRFLPYDSIQKVDLWFGRYGYWIIVANRFLSGTRAIVAFFAGMSDLRLLPTFLLSLVSALAWNAILVSAGYSLGANWREIGLYLSTYGQIVTAVIVVLILIVVIRVVSAKQASKR